MYEVINSGPYYLSCSHSELNASLAEVAPKNKVSIHLRCKHKQ